MRKLATMLVLTLALSLPQVAHAAEPDNTPDGQDCRDGAAAPVTTVANGSTEPERFAICVNSGGTTYLYAGGDMHSDDPGNDGFGGTCGSVIVDNKTVASGNHGDDWHTADFDC